MSTRIKKTIPSESERWSSFPNQFGDTCFAPCGCFGLPARFRKKEASKATITKANASRNALFIPAIIESMRRVDSSWPGAEFCKYWSVPFIMTVTNKAVPTAPATCCSVPMIAVPCGYRGGGSSLSAFVITGIISMEIPSMSSVLNSMIVR